MVMAGRAARVRGVMAPCLVVLASAIEHIDQFLKEVGFRRRLAIAVETLRHEPVDTHFSQFVRLVVRKVFTSQELRYEPRAQRHELSQVLAGLAPELARHLSRPMPLSNRALVLDPVGQTVVILPL